MLVVILRNRRRERRVRGGDIAVCEEGNDITIKKNREKRKNKLNT